jgi:hypothetical protein
MATIWTQTDIDKLKSAVASGVLSVTYSGPPSRTVTYQSLAEMRSLLSEMTREVSASPPYRLLSTSKGFDRSCDE